jgi:Ni/Co efflux regulator RcnB
LPRGYYARPYIVHDYYGYRLHAPPRGYHWVRVNQDVVLAAIATGVVLDVLYNHFY